MSHLIRATFHHYSGTITNRANPAYFGKHFPDWGFDASAPLCPFETREAARAAIEAAEEKTYYLGNGEVCRPTLVAVPVHCAPAYIREIL